MQIIAGLLAIAFSAASFWAALTRVAREACSEPTKAKIASCSEPVSNKAVESAIFISSHPLLFTGSIIVPVFIFYSIFVKDIRTFRFAGRAAHFIKSFSLAIGASVARKFSNAYLGFFIAVSTVILVAFFGIIVILLSVKYMHIS